MIALGIRPTTTQLDPLCVKLSAQLAVNGEVMPEIYEMDKEALGCSWQAKLGIDLCVRRTDEPLEQRLTSSWVIHRPTKVNGIRIVVTQQFDGHEPRHLASLDLTGTALLARYFSQESSMSPPVLLRLPSQFTYSRMQRFPEKQSKAPTSQSSCQQLCCTTSPRPCVYHPKRRSLASTLGSKPPKIASCSCTNRLLGPILTSCITRSS